MAADAGTLFIPGHGTVFRAPANTPMPEAGPTAFTLGSTVPTGWTSLGHTSKENMISFSTDGGDATVLDTWLQDAVRTIYASVNWTLGINALQLDKPTLDLAFNGAVDADDGGYIIPASNGGLENALFVLAQDTTASLGFYIPNTSTKLGDSPVFDTENFTELPLSSSIQAADADVIPPLADGRAGLMKLYPPKTLVAA
jgi:hypothetical protein